MIKPKVLFLKKISELEYAHHGKSDDKNLHDSKREQDANNDLIERILREEGCDYTTVTRMQIGGWMVEKSDLVISSGGDGTVIATAAFNADRPQLNLKNDSRSAGALCQHDIEKALRATLRGNYKIEDWTRQEVFLDGSWIGRTLNETAVGGRGIKISAMARYDLKYSYQGETFEKYKKSSGIIIATGTGSTGWQEVFTPFPRSAREFVFKTTLPDCVETKADHVWITYRGHKGRFSLDCADEAEYDFPKNSTIEIRLSDYPLRVIVPNIGQEK